MRDHHRAHTRRGLRGGPVRPTIGRRTLLAAGLGLAAGATLGSCSRESSARPFVEPGGAEVQAAERDRQPGPLRQVDLTATTGLVDLGGLTVETWSYGGRLPGEPIRVSAGEQVRARVTNRLPVETSIHWHGLALRNDADGVPGVTQPSIGAADEFVYQFTAVHPGTFWFHPHVGPQLDRGLYAPFIVEDPQEPLKYDAEWVVVLDDWLDGVSGTPDDVLAELTGGMEAGMGSGMAHGSMDMEMPSESSGPTGGSSPGSGGHMLMDATSDLLGGDAGDVAYPHYLLNGRLPSAPDNLRARPGARVRIRLINAAGDTAFRVALDRHRLTVTHTDGFPVEPVDTDALLIGMGERYDVLVTLQDGAFPLVALAEGKDALARGLIRTSDAASVPAPAYRPVELDRAVVAYAQMRPAEQARLASREPDRTIQLKLTGSMMGYDWGINGEAYDPQTIHPVREGERIRLSLQNTTTMWHPMHLHGHTFAVTDSGIRKDTVNVLPGARIALDFDADNPGLWMTHCHNIYHAEAGMMTLIGYEAGN